VVLLLGVPAVATGLVPGPTGPAAPAGPPAAGPSGAGGIGHAPEPLAGRALPGDLPPRLTTVPLTSPACSAPSSPRPAWLAVDAADQTIWVASPPGCVEVFGNEGWSPSLVAAVGVGTDPFDVAIDPATQEAWVTNTGSDNVSVVSTLTYRVVASVAVGSMPFGVAYDPASGDVFVADGAANDVTVIGATNHTAFDTVPVGSGPLAVVADAASGQVFVTDRWSGTVSILSDTTDRLVATVPTGSEPFGAAVDDASDTIYVANQGSENRTVIAAANDSIAATIPVVAPAAMLQGVAYDPHDGLVWVAAGLLTLAAINATREAVDAILTDDPAGIAFDPSSDQICLTNTYNFTVGCLAPDERELHIAVPLEVNETGLPDGTVWPIRVNGSGWVPNATVAGAAAPSFTVWLDPAVAAIGDYLVSPLGTHGYDPSPSSAWYAPVLGEPLYLNVSYDPPPGAVALSFDESGLPAGTAWGIILDGAPGDSVGATDVFATANGSHAFRVVAPPGFVPDPANGSVLVEGGPATVPVTFLPAPPEYTVTFEENGLASGTTWTVVLNGTSRSATTPELSVAVPAGTYPFAVEAVPGYALAGPGGGSLVVDGDATVRVTFALAHTVEFAESGLPGETAWTVRFGNETGTTTGDLLAFSVVNGTYDFSVSNVSGYAPAPPNGSLTVDADRTVPVTFTPLPPGEGTRYAVTFLGHGLPTGVDWTVGVDAAAIPAAGASVTTLLPNGSYAYAIAAPAGYVAVPASGVVDVAGAPAQVVIGFSPVPAAGSGLSGAALAEVALLGAAGGAAAGGLIGLLVRRPQDRPPAPIGR